VYTLTIHIQMHYNAVQYVIIQFIYKDISPSYVPNVIRVKNVFRLHWRLYTKHVVKQWFHHSYVCSIITTRSHIWVWTHSFMPIASKC